MNDKKITAYQMAVTALMAAVMCVLGPLSIPIGAVPISLTNFVICMTVWLLGAKLGTLSVAVYLALGAVGLPVFSGYGAGLAKLAGPTGGYLIGFLPMAFIGGLFIEKSKGQPVISGIGLVLFMMLTAYDTQKLQQVYSYYSGNSEMAERASIYGALTLYLDFINIFLYVVRLLGISGRRRD